MNDRFRKVLRAIEEKEFSIPKDLSSRIVFRIDQKARKTAIIKAFSMGLISLCSLVASVPLIYNAINAFTQSGFYNYLSIIFSDSDIAITYWREISLTIAESIPVISVVSLLVILAVFIWSTLKATSEVKLALKTA